MLDILKSYGLRAELRKGGQSIDQRLSAPAAGRHESRPSSDMLSSSDSVSSIRSIGRHSMARSSVPDFHESGLIRPAFLQTNSSRASLASTRSFAFESLDTTLSGNWELVVYGVKKRSELRSIYRQSRRYSTFSLSSRPTTAVMLGEENIPCKFVMRQARAESLALEELAKLPLPKSRSPFSSAETTLGSNAKKVPDVADSNSGNKAERMSIDKELSRASQIQSTSSRAEDGSHVSRPTYGENKRDMRGQRSRTTSLSTTSKDAPAPISDGKIASGRRRSSISFEDARNVFEIKGLNDARLEHSCLPDSRLRRTIPDHQSKSLSQGQDNPKKSVSGLREISDSKKQPSGRQTAPLQELSDTSLKSRNLQASTLPIPITTSSRSPLSSLAITAEMLSTEKTDLSKGNDGSILNSRFSVSNFLTFASSVIPKTSTGKLKGKDKLDDTSYPQGISHAVTVQQIDSGLSPPLVVSKPRAASVTATMKATSDHE